MGNTRGEIDSSRIPVEGVGGLGLIAMAGAVVYLLPPLRPVGLIALAGGAAIGAVLLFSRHRELRRASIVLMVLLATVLVAALFLHFMR